MIIIVDTDILIDYWKPISKGVYEALNNVFDSDAIIACIALTYDIPVWANDKHFEMMQISKRSRARLELFYHKRMGEMLAFKTNLE